MPVQPLARFQTERTAIAEQSLGKDLGDSVFSRPRSALRNRVTGVAYDAKNRRPGALTTMVYRPFQRSPKQRKVIIHLGFTIIAPAYRGRRLPTSFIQRVFRWPIVTNIAASPAGIGAFSDYFVVPYSSYRKTGNPNSSHREVVHQVYRRHRHE